MMVLLLTMVFVMWHIYFPLADDKMYAAIIFSSFTLVFIVFSMCLCYEFANDMYKEYELRKSMYSLDIFGESNENVPVGLT
jgi:hypothetical protein